MCDPVTASIILTGAAIGSEQIQASKERKAAKNLRRAKEQEAQEKIKADKEARVTQQESVATGQVAGIDAQSALQALSGATTTDAAGTLGAGNVQKKEFIGG